MAEAPSEPMMALAKEIITEMECMICMEYRKLYLLPCGHRLCFVCIGEMIMSFLQTCWILHQPIIFKRFIFINLSALIGIDFFKSTKLA